MPKKIVEGTDFYKPLARKDSLLIKHVDNEVLVYDQKTQLAHCLNENAAIIWQHCDGNTGIPDLSNRLKSSSSERSEREKMVWIALGQLEKSNLLIAPIIQNETQGFSRRQMLKAAGVAALIAAPLVTTIVAPRPAQASTCTGLGGSCATGAECCSGVCSGTSCA